MGNANEEGLNLNAHKDEKLARLHGKMGGNIMRAVGRKGDMVKAHSKILIGLRHNSIFIKASNGDHVVLHIL